MPPPVGEFLADEGIRVLLHSTLVTEQPETEQPAPDHSPHSGRVADPALDVAAPAPDIGRFERPVLVGAGSQARVYRAFDPVLDGDVAIKVLAMDQPFATDWRERFITEARLTRQLGADRVAVVYDVIEVDGQPAMVMEYAEGGTIADRLGTLAEPGCSADDIATLVDELEACLSTLAGGEVVHRDLKPSNLLIRRLVGQPGVPPTGLLTDGERLVVADLGLARAAARTDLTMASGTDGYRAPEQTRPGAHVDGRADLFAATQVVLTAIYGHPLMRDEVERHLSDPAAVEAVSRCLASDPDLRPRTEWASAMRSVVPHPVAVGPPARPGRRRRSGRAAAVSVAVLGVTGLGWWGYHVVDDDGAGRNAPAPSQSATPRDVASKGPQIIGPNTLLIGEPGSYSHERRPGVTYRWELPSGASSDAEAVTVTPTVPEDLTITLVADDQGEVSRSTTTVRVRTR
jgi:hypothetical protein